MPRHFDPFAAAASSENREQLGISDAEVVELATAFRNVAFWRLELDSGLFFGSLEMFRIFTMEFAPGPMNLVELVSRIHADDLHVLMETFERSSAEKLGYHNVYRVKSGDDYKFVRSVAKFRETDGSVSGELIGITYEFLDRWDAVVFSDE